MFESEYGKAAVEVLDILDNTRREDVDKIPKRFIKFLVDIAEDDYVVNFDHSKPINELNLKEKTKEILGTIYIKWWCTQGEQDGYKKQIKALEMKKQEIINARYNPDKLFENRIAQSTVVSTNEGTTAQPVSTQMIEYKESFIKRIWNKIMNRLKK